MWNCKYSHYNTTLHFEEDNNLIRLVSAFYGNDHVYREDQYASNKDLFKDGSMLSNFRFNSGNYLEVSIEFEIRNDTLRVCFE